MKNIKNIKESFLYAISISIIVTIVSFIITLLNGVYFEKPNEVYTCCFTLGIVWFIGNFMLSFLLNKYFTKPVWMGDNY